MLKIKSKISEHLASKGREIVITNVCNLNCGGCCQLVGQFKKDKLWFITLDELELAIQLLEKYPPTDPAKQPITIFGGEPTLHPQWDEILQKLKNHAPTVFWINTNGRLGHKRYQKEDNLVWWVDLHPSSQIFVQTLYAATDAVKLPNDMAYWEKAQKDCPIWNGCQCSIYNKKAYFCENAAAIDWLYNKGANGWDISSDQAPFERTKKEIDEQAKNLCKRCGWCVPESVPRQLISEPTHVSPFNQIDGIKHSLPVIDPKSIQRWTKEEILTTLSCPLDIGIYRTAKSNLKIIKGNEVKLSGVEYYDYSNKEAALKAGREKHEWIVILEPNQVIPKHAFATMINWIYKEKMKEKPRLHFSMPVYEISAEKFDPEMLEPTFKQCVSDGTCENTVKSLVIGFHRDSKEKYDKNIFSKLGHRHEKEGSGLASLWHDKLTDIVGGVVTII